MRLITIGLLFIATQIYSAESGEQLAFKYRCATCHGTEGISMDSRYPHLAGQQSAYLKSRLQSFRAGEQPYNQMNAQASALSDEDIEALAEYYGSKKAF